LIEVYLVVKLFDDIVTLQRDDRVLYVGTGTEMYSISETKVAVHRTSFNQHYYSYYHHYTQQSKQAG
jgi:hypothetical protein